MAAEIHTAVGDSTADEEESFGQAVDNRLGIVLALVVAAETAGGNSCCPPFVFLNGSPRRGIQVN